MYPYGILSYFKLANEFKFKSPAVVEDYANGVNGYAFPLLMTGSPNVSVYNTYFDPNTGTLKPYID